MDERRDLVDREELRVALVARPPELGQDEWDRGRRSGIAVSVALLDAMPAQTPTPPSAGTAPTTTQEFEFYGIRE